ncbi:ATP-binding protein [Streptomyces sp. NPDC051320]|uniref:ATP-binding protein n=1 Tax=Streptomyces sp. NPDC051320 TaxID=3154644 RepID=UPI0034419B8D
MSLSLTRRIARTALLIAAGAAPVVGAAGAASAAELPQAPNLGGVTALDGAGLSNTVDGTAHTAAGQAVGTVGSAAMPIAGKSGLPTGKLPVKGLPLSR